ncbi:hypothetical protein [Chryseobacterium sp. 3008163]|uniref:hypothetical protein n=1 Tax=Chryseobacterium sp. 3008163 TaxID=2478663 RepID=UPI000F0C5652|nr:hypothetical protein [Chryseobacterium sp. 3008163]AYN00701.1 hypothetical protein EAG08_10575 [Chryseobacterium sp. 3008163]
MKSLYIIPFLFLSVTFYAQENKSVEPQDQEKVLKEAKAFEQKMQKESELTSPKKDEQTTLASEQGLEVKEQGEKVQNQSNNQGKLLPNTASFEEILASIPGRQNTRKAKVSTNNSKAQGLPKTATLAEIKKTIPKN